MSQLTTLRDRVKTLLAARSFFTGQTILVPDKSIAKNISEAIARIGFFALVLTPRGEPTPPQGRNVNALQRRNLQATWRHYVGISLVQNPVKADAKSAEEAVFEVVAALENQWCGLGETGFRGHELLNRFFIDSYEPVEDPDGLVAYQVIAFADVKLSLS